VDRARKIREHARAEGSDRARAERVERPNTPERAKAARPGDAAVQELDPIIHERIRLGIVSALAVNDRLSFNELKRILQTTDGNLSVHARKLEEAGYVECDKHFEGRMPKTDYRLSASGRRSLQRYLDRMEEIIRTTRG
jgi:DNA-binding transcriptional ArsR family regulator